MKSRKSLWIMIIVLLATASTAMAFFRKKPKPVPVPLTLTELRQYDGQDGRPMYVAVEGQIYDLTKCTYWKDGVHDKSPANAIAGRDMTEVLKESKHGMKRVQRFPLVGYLVEEESSEGSKGQELPQ